MSILQKFTGPSRNEDASEEEKRRAISTHNSDDYLLALDIGTEYVKALIAKKTKGDLKIVGIGKAHEAPTNMFSGAIADIQGVAKTCEEALVKALNRMTDISLREILGQNALERARKDFSVKKMAEEYMKLYKN